MPAKNIVFIDSQVSGSQSIVDGLSEPAEVFILEGGSDWLTQMAGRLKGPSGVDTIQVISHLNAASATGDDVIASLKSQQEVRALVKQTVHIESARN